MDQHRSHLAVVEGFAPQDSLSPTFTVVIPAYNYADRIVRAIDSVFQQTRLPDELIVIDDGSKDHTYSVLQEIQAQYADQGQVSFIIKTQQNKGVAATRNEGFRLANSSYIIFLDADDQLLPSAVAIFAEHIIKNPEKDMFFAGHISTYSGAQEKVKRHAVGRLTDDPVKNIKLYMLKKFNPCSGSFALHRSVMDKVLYPENFRACEDQIFYPHVLSQFESVLIDIPTVRVNKHIDSMRHDVGAAEELGLKTVEAIFSSPNLHPAAQVLKNDFLVRRSLSLFRSFSLAKDRNNALLYYKIALKYKPFEALRIKYLRKLIRLIKN